MYRWKKCSCVDCGAPKNSRHFNKTKGGEFGSRCIECSRVFNKKIQVRVKHTPMFRLATYKSSAKRRGIAFLLTREQFMKLWRKPCRYCGAKIRSIGIDRVDNFIGYVWENIVPCCRKCNTAKNRMSLADFCRVLENKKRPTPKKRAGLSNSRV